MMRVLFFTLLLSSTQAFVLPAGPTTQHVHRHACTSSMPTVHMQIDDKEKGSTLNVTEEEKARRKEKKKLIDRLLPAVFFGTLAVNIATGGKLQNVQLGLPGPGPPGMDKALQLKAEKGYK